MQPIVRFEGPNLAAFPSVDGSTVPTLAVQHTLGSASRILGALLTCSLVFLGSIANCRAVGEAAFSCSALRTSPLLLSLTTSV